MWKGSTMVFKEKISPKIRAFVKYHASDMVKHGKDNKGLVQRLMRMCKISQRSVYRLLKEPLHPDIKERKPAGRKRKLTQRTEKRMIRNISKLRALDKNWIAQDLMKFTDINNISVRSVRRYLNRNQYHHQVARKKGVISTNDCKKRLKFAKTYVNVDKSFWEEHIAFYFDGAGFVHKVNPYENATSLRSKVWRRDDEGLHKDCTGKGSKVGNGGKQAKFFVAISYNRGVILAEQYEKLNGQSFSDFIRKHFEEVFDKSGKSSNLWLQDGDPSQNSKKATDAQEDVGAQQFSIPPRSPELNPIENVFSFVKKELRVQAIQHELQRESYEQFSLRVKATLYSTSTQLVNNIIESYGDRLSKIILKKGGRIEY